MIFIFFYYELLHMNQSTMITSLFGKINGELVRNIFQHVSHEHKDKHILENKFQEAIKYYYNNMPKLGSVIIEEKKVEVEKKKVEVEKKKVEKE